MKTKRPWLAGLALGLLFFVLLVASAQAGAAKPQPNKVKQTAKPIWTLAMDGPRVAYASAGRVHVWNVATGATSVVKGGYGNATHRVAVAVAIAGKRVAWIKRQRFRETEESDKLYTAPIGGWAQLLTQGHLVGWADSSRTMGGWIGGLVGSGKVLAVSTWQSNGTVSSDERLSLITPTGLRTIVTGPGAIVAAAVNGGHIAVLRSTAAWPAWEPATPTTEPTVGIYSTEGTLLREIALTDQIPPPYTNMCCTIDNSIALSGDRLVVLTETATPHVKWTTTLQVYNWRTGTLVRTWPLACCRPWTLSVTPLAVYGRLAAIEGASLLNLVDLTTGNYFPIAHDSYVNDTGSPMAIGSRGLVYTPNPRYKGPGELVFVPMAKLLAMVSQ
jgi:hypothetical protein